METVLIQYILLNDRFTKKYSPIILFRDQLVSLKRNKIYVIHTATTSEARKANILGGHVFGIDTITPKKVTFFDSYGRFASLPYTRLKQIVKKYADNHHFEANTFRYQDGKSTICAHLTIYFLLLRARGYTLTDIQRDKFSTIENNLIAIPSIIESLLPPSIQKKRKKKTVINNKLAISHD